jgi:hypothetical protein
MWRNIAAVVTGTAAVMALAAPVGATAAPTDELVLPAPTGRHPVGMAELHLVDRDRPDPWVPTGPRELMVSVWYPAAEARGDRVVEIMRTYVTAFADLHLRHRPQPLLDGSSPLFPEVLFTGS